MQGGGRGRGPSWYTRSRQNCCPPYSPRHRAEKQPVSHPSLLPGTRATAFGCFSPAIPHGGLWPVACKRPGRFQHPFRSSQPCRAVPALLLSSCAIPDRLSRPRGPPGLGRQPSQVSKDTPEAHRGRRTHPLREQESHGDRAILKHLGQKEGGDTLRQRGRGG